MPKNPIEKYSLVYLFLIVLMFLAIVAPSLDKPFIIDEILFVKAADAINEKGIPVFINDESQRSLEGTWHPPLYMYILSGSFALFGVHEKSARIVSVIFSIGTLLLIYFTSLKIFNKNNKKEFIALFASFIYAISPLVIQSSLLVDIDGSILSFFTMLFSYFFLSYYEDLSLKKLLMLGFLLFLIIASKFQGSFIIILSVFLFFVFQRKPAKAFVISSVIFFAGWIIFLIAWFIYASVFDVSFMAPFLHNFGILFGIGGVSSSVIHKILLMVWSLKNVVFWTTPPFFMLVILVLFARIFSQKKEWVPAAYFLVVGLITFILFTLIQPSAYGFPKYFITMMPGFAICISYLFSSYSLKWDKHALIVIIAIAALTTSLNLFFVKDPFIAHNIFYTQKIDLSSNFLLYLNSNMQGLIYFIPLAASVVYLLLIRQKLLQSLLIGSIIVLICTSIYINIVQINAPYSTSYAYGQEGMMDAAAYIQRITGNDEKIISREDIAYYAKRSYYKSYPLGKELKENFDDIIKEKDIGYIVISPSERLPDFSDHYTKVAEFGHFTIYGKKVNGNNEASSS